MEQMRGGCLASRDMANPGQNLDKHVIVQGMTK